MSDSCNWSLLFFFYFIGDLHTFEALDSDPMLVKLIDAQCPVGGRVELKVGAQVSVCTRLFGKDQQIKWHKQNEGITAKYRLICRIHILQGTTMPSQHKTGQISLISVSFLLVTQAEEWLGLSAGVCPVDHGDYSNLHIYFLSGPAAEHRFLAWCLSLGYSSLPDL